MMEEIVYETKLVQVFLSGNASPTGGIFEVSLTKDKDFVCTCPGFVTRAKCKHVHFVEKKVHDNDGIYPLEISTRCTPEDADRAASSPEAFREFIVTFGKIEVC
jgi:hypothetical protein